VREFFDASVLIAAFWAKHVNHEASIRLVASANKRSSACGLHSVAEVYATMSALPVQPMIPTEQVLLFVEEIRTRLTLVSLEEIEFFETVQKAAQQGLTSGKIYDALLFRCAAKCKAQTIYTWNLKNFQAVATDLADRIRNP